MKVWIHRYSEYGALLKFEFTEKLWGYGDLHPWPQLGQGSIEEHLKNIKMGIFSPHFLKTLSFAKTDAEARFQKTNLFFNLSLPSSHYLITQSSDFSEINQSVSKIFKIKVNPDSASKIVENISNNIDLQNIKLRIDMNGLFSEEEAHDFFSLLFKKNGSLHFIDFIEDPTVFDLNIWKKIKIDFGLNLAVDHQIKNILASDRLKLKVATDILVFKPSYQISEEIINLANSNEIKICATHSLDHPLGRLCAYWEAAKLQTLNPGLCVPGGFFSDENLILEPPPVSLALDSELKKLNWDFFL